MAYPIDTYVKIHNRSAATINGLQTTPAIQSRFQSFIDEVYSRIGLLLLAYSGQRSYAEQWELRKKYLTGGPRASEPGGSWHNFGRAIDIVPVDYAGTPNWKMGASGWKRVADIAAKYGIKSGASFGDPGHFKYEKGTYLAKLRRENPGWEAYKEAQNQYDKKNKWVKPLVITSLVGLLGFTIFTTLKNR